MNRSWYITPQRRNMERDKNNHARPCHENIHFRMAGTSNLDRAISRLREEFDTFSQQERARFGGCGIWGTWIHDDPRMIIGYVPSGYLT